MTTTIPTGKFVWFEYVSSEVPKAQGFFGELFNWGTQSVPMPDGAYTMIALAGGKETIGGYTAKTGPHSAWLAHLQVANAAETCAKIKSLGGKVGKEPFKVGEMGTMAIAFDPYGGGFALWQPNQVMGTGDYKGVTNAWCWNELYTDHPEESVKFYAAIGGFTPSAMDMGPMGTYHVLNTDGKSRAGIMKSPMPGIPQHWMPYVQVDDTDAVVAKAKRLGADIKLPPNDVPDVGRLAVFIDPLGASIGVLQPPANAK